MNLVVKPAKDSKEIVSVAPASAGWRYISFSAYRLAPGERITFSDDANELCVVVLTGIVSAQTNDHLWKDIGRRMSVFEDLSPYAVYIPPKTELSVTAKSESEIAVAGGPAKGELPARLIEPSSMKRGARGKGSNTRYVCDILPQDEAAESVLVVEVRTPSGHSSSYPPHKHDVDNIPIESQLQETYYHRINPPQGFVFQRVYSDSHDLDQSMAVSDRNVVLVPRVIIRWWFPMATNRTTLMSWRVPSASGISTTTRITNGCSCLEPEDHPLASLGALLANIHTLYETVFSSHRVAAMNLSEREAGKFP